MVRSIVSKVMLVVLLACSAAFAQTAQYTWTGSTDSSQGVGLASIDGIPANQATGWGGSIQIVNGGFLWLLDLPYCQYGTACVPMGFPNNGFLDCETAISWGTKQWGIRPDGTQMDGTKAGDSYTLTGSTVCPLWNGTTDISVTEFRMMVQHRSCGHGHCITFLVDTMESGNGTATVE